jgi:ParB family chromosome partitioning protein
MAQRASGFAKKPPAAAVVAPRVEPRAPLPEEDFELPDPIPLDIAPLVAPYRKRGRVTVRVERLPHRARLSHGQNNGDRSWSLTLDELEGAAYLPGSTTDQTQTLSIRIIRVDGGDAATLAVLDYPLRPNAEAESVDDAPAAAPPGDDRELRALREELTKALTTLEARTSELAELRRSANATPRPSFETELAAMKASWEAEVEDRLAMAAKAAADDLEKQRAKWRVEEELRAAKLEKRSRESGKLDAGEALAKAENEWKAQEAARLAAAEAKWQQQSAKTLAELTAELEKAKSKPAPAKVDDSEVRQLRDELTRAKATLAGREKELAQSRSNSEAARGDTTKLGQLSDELTRTKATLAGREKELAQSRANSEAARGDAAKLGQLSDELKKSKAFLADREIESARARADADALRGELEKTRASLATRDDELRRIRSSAEQARAEADTLRDDGTERARLSTELASVKSSLAVRDAELARARAAQDDVRNRAKQEAETSLAEARKNWQAGEAERLAAEEAKWRKHADMAIAEVVARLDKAENRAQDEAAKNRSSGGDLQRLSDGLAQIKATLSERENDLVQARLAHEQARERWRNDSETALTKAYQDWKAGEAERVAESEQDSTERSKLALANMTTQVKQLEASLTEARGQIEILRHRGDSADFRQLRKEFAALQSTLAQRENELMQIRSDHEIDRERIASEARVAVNRAEHQWKAEDAEESEREHRAQTARKLLRDAVFVSGFVGLAMLGYYTLAPMLSDSAPDILQPILNQAGIDTGQPSPTQSADASAKPTFTVLRSVNLRGGPATSAAVIASLPKGAKVTSLETKGNWVHVQFADAGGKLLEGWAFQTFLQADAKPAAPAAPAPKPHSK